MEDRIIADVNLLGKFCGLRNVKCLSRDEIEGTIGKPQADVMVLFGGSVLEGGDVFARAIKDGIAKKYIIVGGAGHTTQTLRDVVKGLYPDIVTKNEPEAVIFNRYIEKQYGESADYLETASTNCGNNITNLLELINSNGLECDSIILCQDSTMQKRMDAALRKHAPQMKIINYAAYDGTLGSDMQFVNRIRGMWNFDRYLTLLMGEIPRLSDDANGYGPRGKDYIAHTDMPVEVREAYERLSKEYNGLTREANPLYG